MHYRDVVAGIGRSDLAYAIAAFGLGLLCAIAIFPSNMLLGRWSWISTTVGDHAAANIGYMYFALDEWRWPLFHTVLMNPPGGVNVLFTDPVPIVALLGKLVFKLTGRMLFYTGPWIALCYGLQALVGYAIFRQLGIDRLKALAASVLLVLVPEFIYRNAHIGLVAQFIVLLSILSYLRATTVAGRKELAAASLGVGAIVILNPYLLAMSAPVHAAGIVEAWRRHRIGIWEALLFLALTAGLAAATVLALQFITFGSAPPATSGFGHFSLNLLSPLMPQYSLLPWFRDSSLDMTGGQYEGFNYLGAGILLLLAVAIIGHGRVVVRLLLRNPVLVAVLIGLTLFATSDKVWFGPLYLGDWGYADLPIVRFATAIFRSSGRFFWPVGFIIVIASVTVIARGRRGALPVLLAAIVIQIIDISPLLVLTRETTTRRVLPADLPLWQTALGEHRELLIFPTYYCTEPKNRQLVHLLQLRAAPLRIPTNSAHINRGDPDCIVNAEKFMTRIDADAVTADPLIVIFKNSFPDALLAGEAARGYSCRDAGEALACAKRIDGALSRLGKELAPPQPIAIGEPQYVGFSASGGRFMGMGWSGPEGDWRWGQGQTTKLVAKLPRPFCKSLSFKAFLMPLSYREFSVRKADISLNGAPAGEIALDGIQPQTILHHMEVGTCIEEVTLSLHFADARSPVSLGMNTDPRLLNWSFKWFAFDGD